LRFYLAKTNLIQKRVVSGWFKSVFIAREIKNNTMFYGIVYISLDFGWYSGLWLVLWAINYNNKDNNNMLWCCSNDAWRSVRQWI